MGLSVRFFNVTIATGQNKKKKGAPAGAKAKAATKTFQVGPNTHYEAIGDAGKTPVTLAAIHQGQKVVIKAKNGPADEVDIVQKKKHNQKKKAVAADN